MLAERSFTHEPSGTRDSEPEWVVYPLDSYEYHNNDDVESKFLQSESLEGKRLNAYEKQGLRRTVVGICLSHRYEFPHLLVVEELSTRRLALFSGKMKSWEKPRLVLKKKMEKYVKKIGNVSKTRFNAHTLSNLKSPAEEVDVGEFLGEFWRAEFHSEALPYLPPHVTRPKERLRLYQLILPPKCWFCLPSGFALKALPFFELQSSKYSLSVRGLPHLVSRFRIHCMVEGEIEGPETPSWKVSIGHFNDPTELAPVTLDGEGYVGEMERTNVEESTDQDDHGLMLLVSPDEEPVEVAENMYPPSQRLSLDTRNCEKYPDRDPESQQQFVQTTGADQDIVTAASAGRLSVHDLPQELADLGDVIFER